MRQGLRPRGLPGVPSSDLARQPLPSSQETPAPSRVQGRTGPVMQEELTSVGFVHDLRSP